MKSKKLLILTSLTSTIALSTSLAAACNSKEVKVEKEIKEIKSLNIIKNDKYYEFQDELKSKKTVNLKINSDLKLLYLDTPIFSLSDSNVSLQNSEISALLKENNSFSVILKNAPFEYFQVFNFIEKPVESDELTNPDLKVDDSKKDEITPPTDKENPVEKVDEPISPESEKPTTDDDKKDSETPKDEEKQPTNPQPTNPAIDNENKESETPTNDSTEEPINEKSKEKNKNMVFELVDEDKVIKYVNSTLNLSGNIIQKVSLRLSANKILNFDDENKNLFKIRDEWDSSEITFKKGLGTVKRLNTFIERKKVKITYQFVDDLAEYEQIFEINNPWKEPEIIIKKTNSNSSNNNNSGLSANNNDNNATSNDVVNLGLTYRIGHWNIYNFGSKSTDYKIYGIGQVIDKSNMDLVGLTEINYSSEDDIQRIVDELNSIQNTNDWTYVLQPTDEATMVRDTSSTWEKIGIIYKSSKFSPYSFSNGKVGDSFKDEIDLINGGKQQYKRAPYGVQFGIVGTNKKITTVFAHFDSPGKKGAEKSVKGYGSSLGEFEASEAKNLNLVMKYFDDIDGHAALFFGGDTNLKTNNNELFDALYSDGYERVYGEDGDEYKTSLGNSWNYSQPYDRLFYKEVENINFINENETNFVGFKADIINAFENGILDREHADTFEFKNYANDFNKYIKTISDHTLVYVDVEV
ncbi:hypothetical protein C4M96_02725 [Mycoplasmopsis pullorum]|uniref:MnuA family membrane nuclease n=1 Tax=Mycoplasmopsis pullorum TaxID=48003 RepID=UPI00111B96F9|nr:hypothetical protein [Mycoplasmopsis pullorum]TNK83798.1 hypothetical protein C4M93_01150 [Mycoplasmopsis pullorum]TNK91974.1 hypothetical protein C4M96_02725 [Mycoplasmopsis pullorum]